MVFEIIILIGFALLSAWIVGLEVKLEKMKRRLDDIEY